MSARLVGSLVIAASLAMAVAACSSSTETNGSPSGSPGPSGNPGSVGDKLDKCGSEESSCTAAEVEAYESCVISKCDSVLSECYGSGYKSGSFGGACGHFVSCVNACDCDDASCVESCPSLGAACESCIMRMTTCVEACPEPACMKDDGDDSGDGTGCADLSDCCAGMEDEDERASCEQTLELAGGNDAACRAIYDAQCP